MSTWGAKADIERAQREYLDSVRDRIFAHGDPLVEAMAQHARERAELRAHTRDRIHVDPVASMLSKLLNTLCVVPRDQQPEAVLDATATIMALLDAREAK